MDGCAPDAVPVSMPGEVRTGDLQVRLIQFSDSDGTCAVACLRDGDDHWTRVRGAATTYGLVLEAIRSGSTLSQVMEERSQDVWLGEREIVASGRLLPPLVHPDPLHMTISGTGLTHLGSASARDLLHEEAAGSTETDSMRMFRWGLEAGKPAGGKPGVQPEWFYKGTGCSVVAPGAPLPFEDFSVSCGEEAEIVGLYVIGDGGTPFRVGYALGNEFSDHGMERQNYLYLAHSKLRACSFGPELYVGQLPGSVRGSVRIVRDGECVFESDFLTGEDHMSHSICNLEYHHFKYRRLWQPGQVHCHFFGAAVLSESAGIRVKAGDTLAIECAVFGRPLINGVEEIVESVPQVQSL